MEEMNRIAVGSKLPHKRRFVVKQTKKPSSGNERQPSTVEDNSAGSMDGAEVNRSDVTPPTIIQVPSATYEDHPCWKSWRGRMSRGEYLMFSFVIFPLIAVGLFVLLGMVILGTKGMLGFILMLLTWIILPIGLIFMRMCADVKRFHDMGQSGLRYLAFCAGQVICFATTFVLVITLKGSWTLDWILEEFRATPLWLNVLYVIFGILNFVVLGCVDGTHGPNKYGPDPKGRARGASKTGELANLAQTTKRLKELGAMKASGMISESEYEARRAQILGGS